MTFPSNEMKAGFCAAWHDLVFFPFPFSVCPPNGTSGNGFPRLFFYPVIGAAAGFLLLCAGWTFRLLLPKIAAAMLFGCCAILLLEGKDRTIGLTGQARLLARLFAGDATGSEPLRQMLSSAFCTLLFLAKLLSCASLFFRSSGGMVGAALIVNFALRGELLGFGDVNPHGRPVLECSMQQRRIQRGVTLLLLFLATISRPSVFLLLGMGGALLVLLAERLAIQRGSLEPETIAFWGSAAETAALLLSAAFTLSFTA